MVERKNETVLNPVLLTHGKSVQNWTNPVSQISNKVVLDSFAIEIRVDAFEYINPILTSLEVTTKSYTTIDGELLGEEINYKEAKKYNIECDGYTFGFNYLSRAYINGAAKTAGKRIYYVGISVSSKLLETDYLKGISSETIDAVLNKINSSGMVKLSKESFLNGICSDIDFKSDTAFKSSDLDSFLKAMYKRLKPEYTHNSISRVVTNKHEKALYVGRREGKGGDFFKFYSKWHELCFNKKNGAGIFNDRFIRASSSDSIQNLRTEITMKGKEQAIKWGLLHSRKQQLTLSKLLSIIAEESKINAIFVSELQLRFVDDTKESDSKTESKTKVNKLSMSDRKKIYDIAKRLRMDGVEESSIIYMAEVIGDGAERKKAEAIKVAREAIEDADEALRVEAIRKEVKERKQVSGLFGQLGFMN